MKEYTLEEGLKAIERLDSKRREYSQEADAIHKIQPLGQPYPSFHRALDNCIKIARKQALIWNHIRHYIIADGKTLWQIAIKNGLSVCRWGEENCLDFYGSDIRKMIEKVKKAEPKTEKEEIWREML